MIPRKIRSGRDIFKIGDIIPSKRGDLRIIGKRVRPDYVDYIVEEADSPSKLSRLRRLYEAIRKVMLTPIRLPFR